MTVRLVLWIAAAFAALALPFAVLFAGERIEGRGFLWDFSKGLGFGALAMAGLQFALTARFRRLAHPFGLDIIYLFHRYLALGVVALMLGHFGILYIWHQDALGELNPLNARWELTIGRVAMISFLALVVLSEFRKRLNLEYELWRYLHVGLAILAFAAAVAHVLGVGRYTSEPATRALWLGVTLGWIGLLVWVRLVKPWAQARNPWRLVEAIPQRGGVVSLVFEPLGKPLKRWMPGQFAWLTLENSPFGLREHPFTISSPSEHGHNVTMSIKPLGDFSERATSTEPGAIAYIDGPYGAFSIDHHEDVDGFVMIAGGVGITPMIANLHAMAARSDRRPVILLYANPSLDAVAFYDDLDRLAERMNLDVVHVLDEPPDGWTGESGFIDGDMLARRLADSTRDYQHFLCGPPQMTDAARKHLLELSVPLWRIDSELFDMV
jgi:predicted ferric reductase